MFHHDCSDRHWTLSVSIPEKRIYEEDKVNLGNIVPPPDSLKIVNVRPLVAEPVCYKVWASSSQSCWETMWTITLEKVAVISDDASEITVL